MLDSRVPVRGDSHKVYVHIHKSLSAEFKISDGSITKEYNEHST